MTSFPPVFFITWFVFYSPSKTDVSPINTLLGFVYTEKASRARAATPNRGLCPDISINATEFRIHFIFLFFIIFRWSCDVRHRSTEPLVTSQTGNGARTALLESVIRTRQLFIFIRHQALWLIGHHCSKTSCSSFGFIFNIQFSPRTNTNNWWL